MAFLFRQNPYPLINGRLTGFARYTEVLERNFKNTFTNLMTLIGFLPFAAGTAIAILSSSMLVMITAAIIGGIFAGPSLACMYDAIYRSLRDIPPRSAADYKRAWSQNWKQSIFPGILFCLVLGFDIFMAMLFWWSEVFPGYGTIAIYIFSILMVTMLFSIVWPQIVLFDQPFLQNLKNCLLFLLRYFPKSIRRVVFAGSLLGSHYSVSSLVRCPAASDRFLVYSVYRQFFVIQYL